MIKNGLLFLMSMIVMILSSCSTNSAKETEFTNEGIFCDLPSCLFQAYDSMNVASAKLDALRSVFPPQKMIEVLDRMKAKKFSVVRYDGEKTEDARILKMSSMNEIFDIDMTVPLKNVSEDVSVFVFCDKDGNAVDVENIPVSKEEDKEENVMLLLNVAQESYKENESLGAKAYWLALDKVAKVEIVHPDSLSSYVTQAADYVTNIYNKLVEESKASDDDFDGEDNKSTSKSQTPVKEGIFGDIPDLFEQQIHFNCQHEFYPSQLRNEEMDKIVTPDKVQKVKDQILTKHIHTVDEEGLTRSEAYIGWVQYENHYFSVNINVPVVDENIPIKAEFCDVNGNVLYTSYPTGNPEMGNVIINRGFLSIGSPASQEERLVEDAREAKKVAQVRIVRANRR